MLPTAMNRIAWYESLYRAFPAGQIVVTNKQGERQPGMRYKEIHVALVKEPLTLMGDQGLAKSQNETAAR